MLFVIPVPIQADLEHPENNRELFIFCLDRVPGLALPGEPELAAGQEKFYRGFWLVLPIDFRWSDKFLDQEPFRAWVDKTGDPEYRTIIVRIPSWSYSLQFDRDQFSTASTGDPVEKCCMDAVDNARNLLLTDQDDKKRLWKYLKVKFPKHVKLSARAVSAEAGLNEELELEILTLSGDGVLTGKHNYACFKVGELNAKPTTTGERAVKQRKTKAQLFKEKLLAANASPQGMKG